MQNNVNMATKLLRILFFSFLHERTPFLFGVKFFIIYILVTIWHVDNCEFCCENYCVSELIVISLYMYLFLHGVLTNPIFFSSVNLRFFYARTTIQSFVHTFFLTSLSCRWVFDVKRTMGKGLKPVMRWLLGIYMNY